VRPPGGLPLDWLQPTLDECRRVVDRGVLEFHEKSDVDGGRQVVTNVDLEVERVLISEIRKHVPGAQVLSEETKSDLRTVDDTDMCFVIDPIDGTEELVAGRSGFSISVAPYQKGLATAAVLDFPRYPARFECGAAQGTWRDGNRFELRSTDSGDDIRIAVSASQHRDPALRHIWESLEWAVLVPTPAFTPKFATILHGECDAAIHLPVDHRRTFLWDYASAAMLLVEAGGVFVSWTGENLFRARPLIHAGGWIAAASSPLQVRLRDTLERHLRGLGCDQP
jgi:fructose-1,6-bisphosphatase/inositol monophosphatase family enzyme